MAAISCRKFWRNGWPKPELWRVPLAPLQGMALTSLDLSVTQVKDLMPLKGMPLTNLDLRVAKQVQDLTPLEGMRLTYLNLGNCSLVRELEPLRGMPLKELWIYETGVADVRPLQGAALEHISLSPGNITQGMAILRDMKSLKTISTNFQRGSPAAAFWAAFDKGDFKK